MDHTDIDWEQVLESEGLGVIDVEHGSSTDHIPRGKMRRLDQIINSPQPSAQMSQSLYTAVANETRSTFSWEVNGIVGIDGTGGDTVLDCLATAVLATKKEAELADRARAFPLGLDSERKPRQPKIRRLSRSERAANIRARQCGEPEPFSRNPYQDESPEAVQRAVPKCDFYMREQGIAPCAGNDAGSGPLSIVDRPKPSSSRVDAEPVRMSPVVDTEGYPPGRSPFQMSLARGGRQNSDITG
jgi:hypothetical protein